MPAYRQAGNRDVLKQRLAQVWQRIWRAPVASDAAATQ